MSAGLAIDYEPQKTPLQPITQLEPSTIEAVAVLIISSASVALCSLSWWMALQP
jgi:hypothetical protein